MEVRRVAAARYGALANLQVADLGPGLHVVLGPNGSGKTSLLRFVRGLLSDAAGRLRSSRTTPPASGFVEIQNGRDCVRIIRIARPGHPDTVATVARTMSEIEEFRRSRNGVDEQQSGLVRLVETAALHQTSDLARIAADVTGQLSVREFGDSWRMARSLPAVLAGRPHNDTRLVAVVRQLSDLPDEPLTDAHRTLCDLTEIDANWKTAIHALSQQREHLRLQLESLARVETRQQHEWQTQRRWLTERADGQLLEIERLDADWQAAACDLPVRGDRRSDAPSSGNGPVLLTMVSPRQDVDRDISLLTEVLQDLSQDRLQVMLQIAQTHNGPPPALATELERIDGCEREVIARMQFLRQRRRRRTAPAVGCVCPTCGAPQADESPVPDPVSYDTTRPQRSADLQRMLFAARAAHAATCRRIARIDAIRRRSAGDAGADRLRYTISVLGAQIEEFERRRESELHAGATVLRHHVHRRLDILQRAGRNLSQLTAGRYLSLKWSQPLEALLAAGPDADWTPVNSLSRGTIEQVAMSMRLAILHGLSSLGENGPVLWDEPLADSDEQRLIAAAALLAADGRSGGQTIVFTCREHVAEAMQAAGAQVHRLGMPGKATVEPAPMPAVALADSEDESESMPPVHTASPTPMRVLPGSIYWLRPDASLEQVPSIGQQMVRRLRALGVADVGDLLEFDPASNAVRLADVQINAALVHIWQAEAHLLTDVPELTGRDAQLLVSCGVMTRSQLAAADIDELTRRIDRLRGGESLRWRAGPSTAPHRETIERWVASARGFPPVDPSPRAKASHSENAPSRRGRGRRSQRRTRPTAAPASPTPRASAAQFRLQPDSPIVDAPSIGHKTAVRLRRVGISTVQDLLTCNAEQTAFRLKRRRITAETILTWRQQAELMCSVPDLRCGDAIVLVACGINGPLDLRRISASALHATLEPFTASASGQRLLRGAGPPTFQDMARWIETVEESRLRRAA